MVEHPLIKLQGSGLSVFKQILYDANKFVRCMCIISRLHKCAEKKTTTCVCCKCQLHRWPFVSVSCLDLQVVWCSKPPWIKHYSNIKVAWLARWKQRACTAGNTFNRRIFTVRSEAAGEKEQARWKWISMDSSFSITEKAWVLHESTLYFLAEGLSSLLVAINTRA